MKYEVLERSFIGGVLFERGSIVNLPERKGDSRLREIVPPKPPAKPTPDLTPPTTK